MKTPRRLCSRHLLAKSSHNSLQKVGLILSVDLPSGFGRYLEDSAYSYVLGRSSQPPLCPSSTNLKWGLGAHYRQSNIYQTGYKIASSYSGYDSLFKCDRDPSRAAAFWLMFGLAFRSRESPGRVVHPRKESQKRAGKKYWLVLVLIPWAL